MTRDIRPFVAPPREIVPLPLGLGLASALAVGLYLALAGHQAPPAPAPLSLPAPTPPLTLPDAPAPAPIAMPVMRLAAPPLRLAPAPALWPRPALPPAPRFGAPLPANQIDELPRMAPPAPRSAPGAATGAMIYDATTGAGGEIIGQAGGAAPARASADEPVHAGLLRNRAWLIPEGTILAAVLETPLVSDHPGLARALISEDVRSFDGSRVLIPRGSRLVGEFKADTLAGQRRILVGWNRLIRADGVVIRLASPATDPLGGAGIAGSVNSHFAGRFAAALLQSALAVGVNVASEAASSGGTALYLGLPSQGAATGAGLLGGATRAPTVKVREGAEIAVLVAHDLDFAGTPAWK